MKEILTALMIPLAGTVAGAAFVFLLKKEISAWMQKLMLAVTIHNLPEGMAVGATLVGAITSGAEISMAAAFAVSISPYRISLKGQSFLSR